MDTTVWQGVLIEESLKDLSILPKITILKTRTTTLEGEGERGAFHFHNVEVLDNNLEEVVQAISQHIKDSWYFHLVRSGEMIVIFHNKVFKAHRGEKEGLEKIREYGMSQGILREQLGLELLFDNPFL